MVHSVQGNLLNAYAFGTMGSLAMIAAIVALVAASLLAALSLLGLRHSRDASGETQMFDAPTPEPIPA